MGAQGCHQADFGVILGSIWVQNDIRISVQKNTDFRMTCLLSFWASLGRLFGTILGDVFCLETIHNEKDEHVICGDRRFSTLETNAST